MMNKSPFLFRPRPNILAMLSAIFAAYKTADRDIDPPNRNHQGASNKSGGSQSSGPRISKKERKRREHIRHLNPNRKH